MTHYFRPRQYDFKQTSEEWKNEIYTKLFIEPTGWDQENYKHSWYEEEITLEEFEKRLSFCSIFEIKKDPTWNKLYGRIKD
jgi:hypothetical protein